MNETDIKKCIKNGYAWSSCGDKPEKTPTKDYTRSQLKTFDGLHATKHSAQLAIATRREDEPANNHAEVKCDMPETLMLSGKLYKRLAEGEPREIGDVPVDGSQTNRFGSVYYRPIAETPEQREDERVAKRKSEGAAKPKTIHEWLLTLPDGYRELALKNEDKAFWPHSEKIENLSDAINFGFGWEKSSEGVDFWEKVYIWAENPSENKLPPIRRRPAMSDDYADLRAACMRLLGAIENLGKVKDGKTLFEGSPTNDNECWLAWRELHDARMNAFNVIERHQP